MRWTKMKPGLPTDIKYRTRNPRDLAGNEACYRPFLTVVE